MTHDVEMKQMQDIATDIALMLKDREVDLQTGMAAMALLMCNIGRESDMPLDDLIEAFTNSAKLTYSLPEETLQ